MADDMYARGSAIESGTRARLPRILLSAATAITVGLFAAAEGPAWLRADEAKAAAVGRAVGTVTISLPPAGTGKPFGASTRDLAAKGYVEEEYFFSGTANRYRIKNPLQTAEIVDSGHPYTSRILVRRPSNPAKFNGIVLVEWFNVSAQQDFDYVFGPMRDHLLAQGYAWVGVSAQTVGANRLRIKNPVRYGAINLTASNADPKGGVLDGGIEGVGGANTTGGDVLSWGVFTQIGAALRKPGALDPLKGLKPRLVIAAGESQSAFRLTDYYNSILPLYPNVFDGFFAYDRLVRVRTDLKTKFWGLGSEPMTERMGPATPDGPSVRVWEVAGGGHVDLHDTVDYGDEQAIANGVFPLDPPWNTRTMSENYKGCDKPALSRVRNADVLAAGLEGLVVWIKTGKAPASAPRFATDRDGKLVTDKEGKVIGGVRLAAYDAPMSESRGRNSGPRFCYLLGSHIDYTPAQMCRRYGSQANYVAQVIRVSRRARSRGFLLKSDADRTIREAQEHKFSCS